MDPDGLGSTERSGEGVGNRCGDPGDGRCGETVRQADHHFEEGGDKDWERDFEEPLWHTVAAVAGDKNSWS